MTLEKAECDTAVSNGRLTLRQARHAELVYKRANG
jgi:hypothetical protein